jgi:hypothetical protein
MTDLERLIAIEDLRYLKARYARYADSKDWDALAGLFTPEATFTPHGVDGEVQVKMFSVAPGQPGVLHGMEIEPSRCAAAGDLKAGGSPWRRTRADPERSVS